MDDTIHFLSLRSAINTNFSSFMLYLRDGMDER
jgi:hypothetical protein